MYNGGGEGGYNKERDNNTKVRDLITENIQADTGAEHLKDIKELLSKNEENEED